MGHLVVVVNSSKYIRFGLRIETGAERTTIIVDIFDVIRRGVRYSRCPSLWILPLSLFDLIAIPLSLLLHFIPLSLSLLCLPIWTVLHHLYMYMVAFLALRIL